MHHGGGTRGRRFRERPRPTGRAATRPVGNGEVVGFFAPLDRLAVRQIRPWSLSGEEQIEIAGVRQKGVSVRGIADRLGRARSTISRGAAPQRSSMRRLSRFEAHRQASTRALASLREQACYAAGGAVASFASAPGGINRTVPGLPLPFGHRHSLLESPLRPLRHRPTYRANTPPGPQRGCHIPRST